MEMCKENLLAIDQQTNTRSRMKALKQLGQGILGYFPESGDYGYGPFILPRGLLYNQYLGIGLMMWMVEVMGDDWEEELKNVVEDVNKLMSPLVMEV